VKVLVVGSGGREHTLAWQIKKSPKLSKVYCAPGNAGTASLATNIPIPSNDVNGLLEFALSEQIDLTVVGPEDPLVAGITDHFQEAGQAVIGPTAAAAQLEGSKAFAKNFMKKHGIPTADYQTFSVAEEAADSLRSGRFRFPVVLKADGLAAGKGVFICPDLEESLKTVTLVMQEKRFGDAGNRLVIEEFLEGEEASFMVFSDGIRAVPMVPSQDHKTAYDEDKGPNTGGMGTYSSDSILSNQERHQVLDQIITPTIKGMAEEGHPYHGILYAGLMITSQGPKVLEFNVRLGDPETQVVLPRIKSDLLDVFQAMAAGSLAESKIEWSEDATVCVVIASGGYPESYATGKEISGLDMVEEDSDTVVFHAGTSLEKTTTITSGGRVLGVTSQAPNLRKAILKAYEGVNKIHFEDMHYRRDIATKGLKKEIK
jgi:phosphoribosylamine--glycine ligase